MILADTDILIDFLQGREPGASRVQLELEHGQLFTTSINRFELLSAARSARQARLIRQLLDAMPCFAVDQAIADRAAELYRGFVQRNETVSMNTCMVATAAVSQHAQLLTHEREAFANFPDLAFAAFAE